MNYKKKKTKKLMLMMLIITFKIIVTIKKKKKKKKKKREREICILTSLSNSVILNRWKKYHPSASPSKVRSLYLSSAS